MRTTLSDNQLNELLLEVIDNKFLYYSYAKDYFRDLYMTGCRSAEPLAIERWEYCNGMIVLQTFKSNSERLFQPTILSNSLLIAISDRTSPYNGLTYDQLTYEFRKVVRWHPIYSGNRIADTYLFRYNRAKQLFKQTNSISEVMKFFSWNTESIASHYVTAELTRKTVLF